MRNLTTRTFMMIAISILLTNRSFAEKPISILVGYSEKEIAKMKEIEKALDKTCDLSLEKTSLAQLRAMLSKQMGVEVQLDKLAFVDASIDLTETTLTNRLKNISYRAAIKLILNDIEADAIVHNEVLLITTKEKLNSDPAMFQTKIYPVEDLVTFIELNKNKEIENYVDFESMIELITTSIVPSAWQDTGQGEGTISGLETKKISVLVITQTPGVHRKIESLIAKLRTYHQSQKKEKVVSPRRNTSDGGGF